MSDTLPTVTARRVTVAPTTDAVAPLDALLNSEPFRAENGFVVGDGVPPLWFDCGAETVATAMNLSFRRGAAQMLAAVGNTMEVPHAQ